MSKKLIIGVDIRDLQLAKTGTKTYLEEVCKAFREMNDPMVEFHFLDTPIPVWGTDSNLLKYVEHLRYQLWKQVFLPLKAWAKGCDILFCTDNFVPLIHLGYKTVPVFHDAFFFENPEHYGKLWLELYHSTAIPAAKRSPVIITPTEYAKKQIAKYTDIPLTQLVVVHEGPKSFDLDGSGNNINSRSIAEIVSGAADYLLHVGSLFKRKNIPALIEAFKLVKDAGYPDLKLVLAGPPAPKKDSNDGQLILEAIKLHRLEKDVIFTGYLSDEELSLVYQHARLYVFPSLNEGFGIPILEAFKHRVPVLVANNTCLPEVGGDAVLQFDPFFPENIADKIKLALADEGLRKELIANGTQRLEQFSWKKTAQELVAIFKMQ
ncbi:glycosyltransferase involved in cell wall biosynthesis [Pedobacter sp. CAN_A7]|uniref:glycosyltransferase family 4 protein n=1 Tax=Pedobacter sp. CAN_A7 TaxID=2787722 RepID=UPI0018CBDFED